MGPFCLERRSKQGLYRPETRVFVYFSSTCLQPQNIEPILKVQVKCKYHANMTSIMASRSPKALVGYVGDVHGPSTRVMETGLKCSLCVESISLRVVTYSSEGFGQLLPTSIRRRFSAASQIRQSTTPGPSAKLVANVRPTGFLCCWPVGLELIDCLTI